jgi:hypothetical protein
MLANIVMKAILIIYLLNSQIKVIKNKTNLYLFFFPDSIDRIILDKPHKYNEHPLNVMKFIPSNIDIMNKKYSSNKRQTVIVKKEPINETDLEKEVFRLQDTLKKMNEDFALQRRELEDDCCEQLKKLNENAEKTHRLHQDLEQGNRLIPKMITLKCFFSIVEYATLSTKYESIKHENDALNEQYLTVELENFEITSYYEQILAEEKAKTIQLETEYNRKLKTLNAHSSSSPSSSKSQLQSVASNDQ